MNGVRIDSATVRKLGTSINAECEKLLTMIDTANTKVAESVSAYDSPSASAFRSKMDDFAANAKNGANSALTSISAYFENIASAYEKTDESIAQSANSHLSSEIFSSNNTNTGE